MTERGFLPSRSRTCSYRSAQTRAVTLAACHFRNHRNTVFQGGKPAGTARHWPPVRFTNRMASPSHSTVGFGHNHPAHLGQPVQHHPHSIREQHVLQRGQNPMTRAFPQPNTTLSRVECFPVDGGLSVLQFPRGRHPGGGGAHTRGNEALVVSSAVGCPRTG